MDNMKISRYIKFPLIFGLFMVLWSFLSLSPASLKQTLSFFVYGAVFGIGMQLYSDYKVRKIKPDAEEKDFTPLQNRQVVLLCDYGRAFDLCLESVEILERSKIKTVNKEKGFIKAKTGITWNSWGNIIEFRLRQITEFATEIEILTRPTLKTVTLDNGRALQEIETLTEFFESKNEVINRQIVEAKFDIPINNNSKDFENVKIKNQ
jgi:hypothetical protein